MTIKILKRFNLKSWGGPRAGSYPVCLSSILGNSIMIQKQSWLFVSDNTNVCWIRVFHLYKGFKRKASKEGLFIKSSARVVEPPRIEYKGFKYKYNIKGDITRAIIVRTTRKSSYEDCSNVFFNTNASITIKKKQDPKSKYINGPAPRTLNRQKFISLFNKEV